MMLKVGLNSLFVKYSMFLQNAAIIVSSFASVIGVAMIAFDVQSYTMKTVCIPSIEHRGKLPMRSI